MKIGEVIDFSVVVEVWNRSEGRDSPSPRSDIGKHIPDNCIWRRCELEAGDLERVFVISSSDWRHLTDGTYRLSRVREDFGSTRDRHTERHLERFRDLREALRAGPPEFDCTLIGLAVAFDQQARITLIDGNHRASALKQFGTLSGSTILLGACSEVRDCHWARYTYGE